MNTEIPTSPYTITSTRTIAEPINKVFRAWTEPEHLKNWWGPNGFTNTFHEFDLRPGGKWKLTMHGPDKGNYENEAEFITIEKPRLIYWKRHSQPLFNVLATFEEISTNETKIVFKMIFDAPKDYETILKFAPEKNEENFDRLEAELKRMKD